MLASKLCLRELVVLVSPKLFGLDTCFANDVTKLNDGSLLWSSGAQGAQTFQHEKLNTSDSGYK
jgi:hypothetical protein